MTQHLPSNLDNDYRDESCDGTWTYQWSIGKTKGRPAYENRLHLPYGESVTVVTELGAWRVDTSGLPRYSAKDMGLEPE